MSIWVPGDPGTWVAWSVQPDNTSFETGRKVLHMQSFTFMVHNPCNSPPRVPCGWTTNMRIKNMLCREYFIIVGGHNKTNQFENFSVLSC